MGVNYREQYEPDQLEPFWPNEIFKMAVVVLCTLAVIMLFAILPVVLDAIGLHGVLHSEEPADPQGATPVGIKPEWYFLASYQFLRIMPTEFLGISGKTLGVLSQGVLVFAILTLPFWYRRRAHQRPRWAFRIGITLVAVLALVFTIWGEWPEEHVDGHEKLMPLGEFVRHKPMLFVVFGVGIVVFYTLVAHEVRTLRRVFGDEPPTAANEETNESSITPALYVTILALTGPTQDPPEDPFADNACVQCHGDLAGRSAEIVELEWKQSVHYTAGVACQGCHGGNPNLQADQFATLDEWKMATHLDRDPEFMFVHAAEGTFVSSARGRSVSYFCGKCHTDIMRSHLGSPHGAFGDPTCLYCHGQGTHRILDPSTDMIDTRGRAEQGRCSPCHLASSMETVTRIKTRLEDTEEAIRRSRDLAVELEERGYQNLALSELHEHADQVQSQLRQVFHSFDMREISSFAGEIDEIVEQTEVTHELVTNLREAQREQALVGGLVSLMLLGFAGLLLYYKHAFLAHPSE